MNVVILTDYSDIVLLYNLFHFLIFYFGIFYFVTVMIQINDSKMYFMKEKFLTMNIFTTLLIKWYTSKDKYHNNLVNLLIQI